MGKLTEQGILDATEKIIYKNGIKKTTLYDVAKDLDVSHAALYKHFSNKDDLFEKLTRQWLDKTSSDLLNWNPLAEQDYEKNLHDWLWLLAKTKKNLAEDDGEMFLLYAEYIENHEEILNSHLDQLAKKIVEITDFKLDTGRGIILAFTYFHNPYFSNRWNRPNYKDLFEQVWDLVKDFSE